MTSTSKLAEAISNDWRLDADLVASAHQLGAWRRRQRQAPPHRAVLIDDFQATDEIRRVDPPQASHLTTNVHPASAETQHLVEAKHSKDSVLSIILCELLAIIALMILLFIEAQHSPHFFAFAVVSMFGAVLVLGLTVISSRRQNEGASSAS